MDRYTATVYEPTRMTKQWWPMVRVNRGLLVRFIAASNGEASCLEAQIAANVLALQHGVAFPTSEVVLCS